MLTALKNRGYHLVILSNCKASYREAHWKEFGMERWFDRFMTTNHTDSVKDRNCAEIIREYTGPLIWWSRTGGRIWNVPESCKSPFIGCLYGYGEGELNGADHLAEHIEDILQLVI